MKRLISVVVAFSCCLMICESVEAQIGRGRLLKRLHNDLTGANKKPAPKPNFQPNKNLQKNKTPINGKNPTPAYNSVYSKKKASSPTLASPASTRKPSNAIGSGTRNLTTPRLAAPNAAPKKGFGMEVSKDLAVTAVDPRGNAAKSGIRPGYKIVEVGGVKIASAQEYDEIAKILSNGDQMEFKIETGIGQTKKVNIDFGTAPEPDSADVVSTKAPTMSGSRNKNSVLDRSSSQIYSEEQVTETDENRF